MADTSYIAPQSLTRVWNYPLVQSLANNAVGCYNYAKEYNAYSKRVLETAEAFSRPVVDGTLIRLEQYSQQPSVEALVKSVDAMACNQLDKVEGTYSKVKEAAPKVLHAAGSAIHGTRTEKVLIKTVGVLDSVVDALLPPKEDGEETEVESEDGDHAIIKGNQGLIEATSPVLIKIKARVSKESVLHLPAQTYSLALRNAELIPVLSNCVKLLNGIQASVLAIHNVIQNKEISRVFDNSLHRVTASVNRLSDILKKVDPVEARVTVAELAKMIAASKDNITKIFDNISFAQKLKEDGSALLLRAGDKLAKPLEAGYVRVANSDIAAIKNTFTLLESAVQGIVASFTVQAEKNRE